VEIGAHLPLIDFGDGFGLSELKQYARTAHELGFGTLCANDHLVFGRPWLDGPTALAAMIDESGEMALATTVSLPVIRGPASLAKTLAAIDLLSNGRLVVGVGPGSSAADYAAVGVPFDERWPRFDESIRALRALLRGERFAGAFYATGDVALEPPPSQRPGPPIWIASWGSPAGMRRVRRLGDGWLASAYNITPTRFRECREQLGPGVPSGVATAWMYVTEDAARAERMIDTVLAPMLRRPAEQLRELALPIGSAERCAERLACFAAAGAERVCVWPLAQPQRQLGLFRERVAPMIAAMHGG
jgi:alkanesulfonate monooxygenase SsuD/methylene tetrahydromethanopterin reductase-like flavin-dependent oxidoreductase (luciferase family)